jgi:hypothetical protein
MRADAGAERLRDGAGEEAVRPRELCVEVVLEPRRGCMLLARGTVAVATGRVHAVGPSTRLALIQAVTITPTGALLEGADDFAVCEGQLGVTLQGVWSHGGADLAEGGHDRSLPSCVDALSGGEGREHRRIVAWRKLLTAASAAYLNNPLELTAHSAGFLAVPGSVPVGRRSPGAFGCSKTQEGDRRSNLGIQGTMPVECRQT